MKALIVEDDFTSRVLLVEILKRYGTTHVAVNGREAVDAVRAALDAGTPYDLVCLDIMMPEMDGQEALRQIRGLEVAMGIGPQERSKVIMTTALADKENVLEAIRGQCDFFLVKPVEARRLLEELRRRNLIQ